MSGDVFGNGMLLSEHIRLVAAFDHRHIFLDPNPDAATIFDERERMFKLPRSSWADYDANADLQGRRRYPRAAEVDPLSAGSRAPRSASTPTSTAMTPDELMSAILKAPVDLLWNGGIGTYVKASSESTPMSATAPTTRCASTATSCAARWWARAATWADPARPHRIRAARRLLNTDFIDNSAGVDTSDHEVNIKILLNGVVQAKKLTLRRRATSCWRR